MPIFRYVVVVGGALLALLFVADHLFPSEPIAVTTAAASNDQPMIRIRSDRHLPERVVFDTDRPHVAVQVSAQVSAQAQPQPASVEARVEAQPAAAGLRSDVTEASASARVRETHAEVSRAVAKPASVVSAADIQSSDAATKASAAPSQARRKIARQHPSRGYDRPVRVAQQPHFGLFDMTW